MVLRTPPASTRAFDWNDRGVLRTLKKTEGMSPCKILVIMWGGDVIHLIDGARRTGPGNSAIGLTARDPLIYRWVCTEPDMLKQRRERLIGLSSDHKVY